MSNEPLSRSGETLEPIEDVVKRGASGWEESLYNCTTGSNYLRASEYYSLIRTLDNYAREIERLRTAQPSETPEQFVYFSARDQNGELQHHRLSIEAAGSVLTETCAAMDRIIDKTKCAPNRQGEAK